MTRAHPNQSSIGHLPVLALEEVQTAPEATLALWARVGGWEGGWLLRRILGGSWWLGCT